MTGLDPTMQQTNSTPDITGLAVAVGQILEAQKFMQQGNDRVEKVVTTSADTLTSHAIRLEEHRGTLVAHAGRLDGHDRKFEDAAPIRTPWTAKGGFVLTFVAVIVSLALGVINLVVK